MTYADANTATQTETRISIIVAQINYVVRETTGATRFKDILEQGMLQNKWISKVSVVALDEKDKIWAEIEVNVDWDKHKINLNRHGESLAIDKTAPEGEQVSWVIGEIVKWFTNYTKKSKFRTEWTVTYIPEITNDSQRRATINKQLGLVAAPNRSWANASIENILSDTPDDLNEMTTRLRVVSP